MPTFGAGPLVTWRGAVIAAPLAEYAEEADLLDDNLRCRRRAFLRLLDPDNEDGVPLAVLPPA